MKLIARLLLITAIILGTNISAEAQFGNLKNKLKKTIEKTNGNRNGNGNGNNTASEEKVSISGKSFYVSTKGSARGDGSKATPMKDIQKAIDAASNGDIVRIAEGNYLGTLDRGWIEIKGKYVSLEGGWNSDFTERNPTKYITRMQPTTQQAGTIGMGLLMLDVVTNKNASMIIDGIFFDLGNLLAYCPANPDPRNGWPEGCETGRMLPVGQSNREIRLIRGNVAGNLTVRNCIFMNASCYGMWLGHTGGNWEIYNNVFVSNVFASVEIFGRLNAQTGAHQAKVDFHHNTVLFSWCRTKEMEDMGYGYRYKNGVDHDVHHNIFGCSNLGALDAGWSEATLPAEKRKICSAYDNYFFMNKGDLIKAGTSGGAWLYVPASRFDEVEELKEYERNIELPSSSNFKDAIDQAYLKGFANLKVMTNSSYDPNSAANVYREAHGMNKQGVSTTRVSMFGNRYNFDKAVELFGVEQNYGAQEPVME